MAWSSPYGCHSEFNGRFDGIRFDGFDGISTQLSSSVLLSLPGFLQRVDGLLPHSRAFGLMSVQD
jgi:hypothetical protein